MIAIPILGSIGLYLSAAVLGPAILLRGVRRSSLPELLLGSGISSAGAIGYPLQLASRTVLSSDPAMSALAQNLGFLIGGLGMSALCFFISRVLRPDSALAAKVAWIFTGVLVASSVLQTLADDTTASTWMELMMAERIVVLGWMALASLRQHRRMRRQLRLGLAEPLAVNRLLLAAIASGATALALVLPLMNAATSLRLAIERPALGVAFGLAAIVASLALWTICVPPAAYVRRIESMAPTGASTGSP
jgi:hypothetical protein